MEHAVFNGFAFIALEIAVGIDGQEAGHGFAANGELGAIEHVQGAFLYALFNLGNLLGVSPVTIIRWETGRLRPSVQAVLAFNYLVHFQGQYFQGFADSTDHLKDIQQATESGKGDVVLPNDFHDHFSPAQIRLLRKTLKLSRMDLSLLIGVTVNAVNKWELGDVTQSEPVNKLLHYLRIYGVESFLRTFHPDKITMSDLNPATLHVQASL